tara:strand:- start:580 stop:1068 length:489 start_codon:yes stop_codon:yes gene_type:complete
MILVTTSLEHMAWSNQQIFKHFHQYPEDVYALAAAENEWSIGKLLTHFISTAEFLKHVLTGETRLDPPLIISSHHLIDSAKHLSKLDQLLIETSKLDDCEILYKNERGPAKALRSTILSQAVAHTAEHKGQIATILKMHGFHLDLDAYDLWAFSKDVNSPRI